MALTRAHLSWGGGAVPMDHGPMGLPVCVPAACLSCLDFAGVGRGSLVHVKLPTFVVLLCEFDLA